MQRAAVLELPVSAYARNSNQAWMELRMSLKETVEGYLQESVQTLARYDALIDSIITTSDFADWRAYRVGVFRIGRLGGAVESPFEPSPRKTYVANVAFQSIPDDYW